METNILDSSAKSPPISHVTEIQETDCDESEWHIARLPKTSAKACFALQAITKRKCVAKIVQDNRSTAAPTYVGLMEIYKKDKVERMQFFFCSDDIERCVKGTKRKWVLSRPIVPSVWPVKIGTNLLKKEILAFQNAGFQLPQRVAMSPRRLFGTRGISVDMNSLPTPEFADDYPKTRSGKSIRRNPKAPTTKQANNCASAITLQGRIKQVTMIPHPGFGCIVTFESGMIPNTHQYMITISLFPECSCPYFKEMLAKSLGKRGQWSHCKHLYYIFNVICNMDPEVDVFIHAPSFSFDEVKRVIERGVLSHLSS